MKNYKDLVDSLPSTNISVYKKHSYTGRENYFIFVGGEDSKELDKRIIENLVGRFGIKEIYRQMKNILNSSPDKLYQIKYMGFSKRDEKKKEQMKNIILRHNRKTLEKRVHGTDYL